MVYKEKKARVQINVSEEFKYTLDVYAATHRMTLTSLLIEGLLATNPELREVYNETDADESEAVPAHDDDGGRDPESATASAPVQS